MPLLEMNDKQVRKLPLPAHGKQLDYYDTGHHGQPGLVLRVNYGGRKTWRVLHYVNGVDPTGKPRREPRTVPLGRFPTMLTDQARAAARRFDPRQALKGDSKGTFREVAENFVKRRVAATDKRAQLRSRKEIERCLIKYMYPHWAHRPFVEINRKDVAELLDLIEDNHGPRMADVVLSIISRVTQFYAERDHEYVLPLIPGMGRYVAADHRRKRILDDDEIRALWKVCGEMGTFGAVVKMLLLTAQRLRKVATMRWQDLHGDEWHIATEDREKSNAKVLKLPTMALDILRSQVRVAGNPYVFPAGHGNGYFRAFDRKQEFERKLPDMKDWVLHDLRRTARSLLSRVGVKPHIAEQTLGHVIKGVEAIYDRHPYYDEKADALKRLAREVETIITPPRLKKVKSKTNVVELPKMKVGRKT